MQISKICIIIIILYLNIFGAQLKYLEDESKFPAYLKNTFSVLKNEKLSSNMRSLLNNLKRDDLRRKYKMRRRKKQVLISNNLKDNPLFFFKEQMKPDVESQRLSNLGNLLSNPLFARNYAESHTRSPDSLNGIDLSSIDKTDAQIVGALYYPSSDANNPNVQTESTDESSSTDNHATQPSTSENTDILFNVNQIPSSVTNKVPQQSGYSNNYNSDYMKSYLENIKMVPVYPLSVSPPVPNYPQVDSPSDFGDILKRCSTKEYQSSQTDGLYNIFSDIYKNLKMNAILTTTPNQNHKENCGTNSVNLLNSKYGTANEPDEGSSDNNMEKQYKKLLNPEVMESIMFSIKNIIDKQNKKLNKCNSNLPKSYENVLTPQLMSLMLNSLSNIISQPAPPAENLNSNDYLDKFIARSTTEKSLLEESYLNKLSRFDLTPQIESNNLQIDLNSLLKEPEKNKELMYTNSPKLFPSFHKSFKSSSARVERLTTLKEKVMPRRVFPTKKQIELHATQPKLSIFSNLNFLKRCDNKTGENETNSKTNEKEAFNTSSAIEDILKIVQEMRNKEKQLSEGKLYIPYPGGKHFVTSMDFLSEVVMKFFTKYFVKNIDVNCNITGSWSSMAGGMLLTVTNAKDILDITLNEKSPPGKKGFLKDLGWIIKGVQPIPKTNLVILTGTNLNSKHVIVFIGECRVCGGSELVTGNWLIGRCSHNCQDQKASQDLLSDVWRREMLTKLVHDRLKGMTTAAAGAAGVKETTTMSTENHTAASSIVGLPNTSEVCSEQPSPSNATTLLSLDENGQNETTTEQKLDSNGKTTNELETKDQKSETTCNGNATEEDLNFLFSSSSATTAASGNSESNNSCQSSVETTNKSTTICESNPTKNDATTKKSHQSGNKMFTLCNLNGNGATTKKPKKTTKVKCTTTPASTTCEETTTENCSSSPTTSCEESSKTTDSNKCMVELDMEKSTTKPKFLNKVIHIFKNKSKTTTEKCTTKNPQCNTS